MDSPPGRLMLVWYVSLLIPRPATLGDDHRPWKLAVNHHSAGLERAAWRGRLGALQLRTARRFGGQYETPDRRTDAIQLGINQSGYRASWSSAASGESTWKGFATAVPRPLWLFQRHRHRQSAGAYRSGRPAGCQWVSEGKWYLGGSAQLVPGTGCIPPVGFKATVSGIAWRAVLRLTRSLPGELGCGPPFVLPADTA